MRDPTPERGRSGDPGGRLQRCVGLGGRGVDSRRLKLRRPDSPAHSKLTDMIASLRGQLIERQPSRLIVDVNGVGYEVNVPVSTFAALPPSGREIALQIYTHVREDALQLYGFGTHREKALFEKLISISGIGPKVALSILSGIPAEELSKAIRAADIGRLTAIPGVGKKTAERVVLELKDKLGTISEEPHTVAAGPSEDLVSALTNLGYARPIAEQTVTRVVGSANGASFEALFKECMRRMSER